MPEDVSPRCRCTPPEIEDGHRHRCPEGPPTFLAVGPWKGRRQEDLQAKYFPAEKPHFPALPDNPS